MNCDRCGKPEYLRGSRAYVGRVFAAMCNSCDTALESHLRTLPEWEQFKEALNLKVYLSGRRGSPNPPTIEEVRECGAKEDAVQTVLAQAIREFIATKPGELRG